VQGVSLSTPTGPPPPDEPPSALWRTRRRVIIALAFFAIGLTLGRVLDVSSTIWFSAALGCCAVSIFARPSLCRVAFAGAIISLGAGWMHARVYERSPSELANVINADRVLVTVEGVVLRSPRTIKPSRATAFPAFLGEPRTRLDVDVAAVVTDHGPLPAAGKLWVRVQGSSPVKAKAGDRLRITGWFEAISPPSNPGEEDLREYAAQTGYSGSLIVSSPDLLAAQPPIASTLAATRATWLRARAALEDRARHLLTRAAGNTEGPEGDRSRALFLGLVLGDYDPSQREVRDAFARQGLAHVLSISGFHLSVMALLALIVLRLTGDRGWLEPTLVALIVILYVLIVPASSPILRSAAMVLGVMAAEASGRRYDRLTLLTWIAMGLLVWRPLDLWNVGFQLSLGLTAALFWLGPIWHARLWGVPILGIVKREIAIVEWLKNWAQQSVSAAIMCWGVSLPLVMTRFGLLSPLAIGATVLVTPLVVAVLWVGYLALLIGVFIPPAADWAGLILGHLCSWSVASVRLFDAMPLSAIRVPVMSGLWCAAATGVIVLWLRTWRLRDVRAWGATAVVAAWLAWQCIHSTGLHRGVDLRIDMLDVGNGSCYLIRSGNEAILWDCGPMPGSGVQPPLVSAVRALGAWRTPTVIITHPDLDHFGGLSEVLEPLGVRRVLAPPRFIAQASSDRGGAVAELVRELKARNITLEPLQAGSTLAIGNAALHFLAPPLNADWPVDNDHSLVAQVATSTDAAAALLTGDMQDQAIEHFRTTYPSLHPRVLELPHHGSARPAAIDFAWNLNPEVVLQSTGALRANDPRWDGVRVDRTWYTTATDGAAWVEFLDNGSIRSGCHRNPDH